MFILGVTFLDIVTKLLVAVNVIVCLLLIFVVLLQRPKNEGLGAAFGGDTASNIFGAQTTNVLSNLTRWLAGIFMVLTLALSILYARSDETKSATSKFVEAARQKAAEDEARRKAEDAAKAANPKPTEPVTKSDAVTLPGNSAPATPPANTPIEKQGNPAPAVPAGTPAPAPSAPAAPTAAPATPPPAEKPADPATPEAPKPVAN